MANMSNSVHLRNQRGEQLLLNCHHPEEHQTELEKEVNLCFQKYHPQIKNFVQTSKDLNASHISVKKGSIQIDGRPIEEKEGLKELSATIIKEVDGIWKKWKAECERLPPCSCGNPLTPNPRVEHEHHRHSGAPSSRTSSVGGASVYEEDFGFGDGVDLQEQANKVSSEAIAALTKANRFNVQDPAVVRAMLDRQKSLPHIQTYTAAKNELKAAEKKIDDFIASLSPDAAELTQQIEDLKGLKELLEAKLSNLRTQAMPIKRFARQFEQLGQLAQTIRNTPAEELQATIKQLRTNLQATLPKSMRNTPEGEREITSLFNDIYQQADLLGLNHDKLDIPDEYRIDRHGEWLFSNASPMTSEERGRAVERYMLSRLANAPFSNGHLFETYLDQLPENDQREIFTRMATATVRHGLLTGQEFLGDPAKGKEMFLTRVDGSADHDRRAAINDWRDQELAQKYGHQLDEVKTRCADLESQLQLARREAAQQAETIRDLQDELGELRPLLEEVTEAHARLEEDNRRLTEAAKLDASEAERLNAALTLARDAERAAREKVVELTSRIEELEEELDTARRTQSENDETIAQLREDLLSEQDKVRDFESQLSDALLKAEENRILAEGLEALLSVEKRKVSDLQSELDRAKDDLAKAEMDATGREEELRREIDELTETIDNTRAQLSAEITRLEGLNEDQARRLTATLDDLDATNEQLTDARRNIDSLREIQADLEGQLRVLTDANLDLTADKERLETRLHEVEGALTVKIEEAQQTSIDITAAQAKIRELEEALATQKEAFDLEITRLGEEKLRALVDLTEKHALETAKLDDALATSRNETKELRDKVQALETAALTAANNLEATQRRVSELETDLTTAKRQAAEKEELLQAEIERVQTQKTNLERDLKGQIAQLTQGNEELAEELNLQAAALLQAREELANTSASTTAQIRQLQQDLEEKADTLKATLDELVRERELTQTQANTIRDLTESSGEEIAQLGEKLRLSEDEVLRLQDKVRELSSDAVEVKAELETAKQRARTLEGDLEQAERKLAEQEASARREVEQVRAEKRDLEAALRAEIKELTNNNQELTARLTDQISGLVNTQSELGIARELIDELEKAKRTLTAEHDALGKEKKRLEEGLHDAEELDLNLREEMQQLRDDIAEKDANATTAKETIAELREQLKTDRAQFEKEKSDLTEAQQLALETLQREHGEQVREFTDRQRIVEEEARQLRVDLDKKEARVLELGDEVVDAANEAKEKRKLLHALVDVYKKHHPARVEEEIAFEELPELFDEALATLQRSSNERIGELQQEVEGLKGQVRSGETRARELQEEIEKREGQLRELGEVVDDLGRNVSSDKSLLKQSGDKSPRSIKEALQHIQGTVLRQQESASEELERLRAGLEATKNKLNEKEDELAEQSSEAGDLQNRLVREKRELEEKIEEFLQRVAHAADSTTPPATLAAALDLFNAKIEVLKQQEATIATLTTERNRIRADLNTANLEKEEAAASLRQARQEIEQKQADLTSHDEKIREVEQQLQKILGAQAKKGDIAASFKHLNTLVETLRTERAGFEQLAKIAQQGYDRVAEESRIIAEKAKKLEEQLATNGAGLGKAQEIAADWEAKHQLLFKEHQTLTGELEKAKVRQRELEETVATSEEGKAVAERLSAVKQGIIENLESKTKSLETELKQEQDRSIARLKDLQAAVGREISWEDLPGHIRSLQERVAELDREIKDVQKEAQQKIEELQEQNRRLEKEKVELTATSAASALEQKTEIDRLTAQIRANEEKIEELHFTSEALNNTLSTTAGELQDKVDEIEILQDQVAEKQDQVDAAEVVHTDLSRKIAELQQDLDRARLALDLNKKIVFPPDRNLQGISETFSAALEKYRVEHPDRKTANALSFFANAKEGNEYPFALILGGSIDTLCVDQLPNIDRETLLEMTADALEYLVTSENQALKGEEPYTGTRHEEHSKWVYNLATYLANSPEGKESILGNTKRLEALEAWIFDREKRNAEPLKDKRQTLFLALANSPGMVCRRVGERVLTSQAFSQLKEPLRKKTTSEQFEWVKQFAVASKSEANTSRAHLTEHLKNKVGEYFGKHNLVAFMNNHRKDEIVEGKLDKLAENWQDLTFSKINSLQKDYLTPLEAELLKNALTAATKQCLSSLDQLQAGLYEQDSEVDTEPKGTFINPLAAAPGDLKLVTLDELATELQKVQGPLDDQQRIIYRDFVTDTLKHHIQRMGLACTEAHSIPNLLQYVQTHGTFPPVVEQALARDTTGAARLEMTQLMYYYSGLYRPAVNQMLPRFATHREFNWLMNDIKDQPLKQSQRWMAFLQKLHSSKQFNGYPMTEEQAEWGERILGAIKNKSSLPTGIFGEPGGGKTVTLDFTMEFLKDLGLIDPRTTVSRIAPFATTTAPGSTTLTQVYTIPSPSSEGVPPPVRAEGQVAVFDEYHVATAGTRIKSAGGETLPLINISATPNFAKMDWAKLKNQDLAGLLNTYRSQVDQKISDKQADIKKEQSESIGVLKSNPKLDKIPTLQTLIQDGESSEVILKSVGNALNKIRWEVISGIKDQIDTVKTSLHFNDDGEIRQARMRKMEHPTQIAFDKIRQMPTNISYKDLKEILEKAQPLVDQWVKDRVSTTHFGTPGLTNTAQLKSDKLRNNLKWLLTISQQLSQFPDESFTILGGTLHQLEISQHDDAKKAILIDLCPAIFAAFRPSNIVDNLQAEITELEKTRTALDTKLATWNTKIGREAGSGEYQKQLKKKREVAIRETNMGFHGGQPCTDFEPKATAEAITSKIDRQQAGQRLQIILPGVTFKEQSFRPFIQALRHSLQTNAPKIRFVYHDTHSSDPQLRGRDYVVEYDKNTQVLGKPAPLDLKAAPPKDAVTVMLYDRTNMQGGDFGASSNVTKEQDRVQDIGQFIFYNFKDRELPDPIKHTSENAFYQAVGRRRGRDLAKTNPQIFTSLESHAELKEALAAHQKVLEKAEERSLKTNVLAVKMFKVFEKAEGRVLAKGEAKGAWLPKTEGLIQGIDDWTRGKETPAATQIKKNWTESVAKLIEIKEEALATPTEWRNRMVDWTKTNAPSFIGEPGNAEQNARLEAIKLIQEAATLLGNLDLPPQAQA